MEPFTTVLIVAAISPYVCGIGYVVYASVSSKYSEYSEYSRGRYHQLPTTALKKPLLGYDL